MIILLNGKYVITMATIQDYSLMCIIILYILEGKSHNFQIIEKGWVAGVHVSSTPFQKVSASELG